MVSLVRVIAKNCKNQQYYQDSLGINRVTGDESWFYRRQVGKKETNK
jgi:hypothetical protein